MLAIIGGSGLTQLASLEVDAAQGRAHAVRRALGRAHLRPHRRRARWCSSRATATATPSRRTRSTTAPTSGRCKRGGRRRASSRSPRSAASATTSGPARWCCRTRSSTTPGAAPRPSSKGPAQPVNHIDFTEPYSRALRERILEAAGALRRAHHRRRRLRRDPGPAPRDRGRDQPPGARRRRHRRHDRHARGRARARDRPASTPRSRWSRTTPPAAATASAPCRSTRSRRCSTRRMGRVRRIIEKLCEQQ